MKKTSLVIVLIVLMGLPLKAHAVNLLSVKNLITGSSFVNSTTKDLIVPATVTGTSGGVSAVVNAALLITPGRGATIMGALIAAGIGYGGSALIDYMTAQSMTVSNGKFQKTGDPVAGFAAWVGMSVNGQSVFATQAEANAWIGSHLSTQYGDGAYATGWSNDHQVWNGSDGFMITKTEIRTCNQNNCYLYGSTLLDTIWSGFVLNGNQTAIINVPAAPRDATNDEIVAALGAGLAAGDTNALKALRNSLVAVNPALGDETLPIAGALGVNLATVKAALAASVTADTTQTLADKLELPSTPDEWAKDQTTANTAASMTKEEVQAAVKAGVADALKDDGSVTPPVDPTIDLPTKLSLTTVLQGFMTSINGLPVISTLKGITVNCSGSPVLCLNLSARLGGSTCYDASPMAGTLNNIGTGLLGLVTVFGFIGVFRG
jgi:hypothetical protein